MKRLGVWAVLVGCGGSTSTDEAPPTWHEDVRPIFDEICTSCHTEDGGITGIPLTTFDEVNAWREPIAAAVAAGTMPPWRADDDCANYVNDFSLSPEEVDTILDWVDADAPEGDPEDAAPEVSPWSPPALERVDRVVEMTAPYTPRAAAGTTDDYRCFIADWPEDETVWVTGYNFRPGNTDVVHHVILFIIPEADADAFRALDEADPDDGYPCFGGPGGDIDSLIEARWLGGWAPGGGASIMPDGYGLRVEPGSILILQVHYNLALGDAGSDQSGLEIQLERSPLKNAEIQPWTEIGWVLGVGMDIAPNSTDVEHTWSHVFEGTVTFHSAALHMHKLGRTAKISVQHPDGTESCLLSSSDYDFNWQRDYWLRKPVTARPGDMIELTCTWDNPTDELVKWGDGTGDEMCLGVTLITWE